VGVVVVAASLIVLALRDDPGSKGADGLSDPPPGLSISGRPSAVAATPTSVWVADDEASTVFEVDPTTRSPRGAAISVDQNPSAMALSEDGATLWITHAGGTVTRISIADHAVTGSPTRVGGALTGVTVGGGSTWITDIESSRLVRLDTAGAVTAEIKVPLGAVRPLYVDGIVWVTNSEHTVTPVTTATGTAGEAVSVGVGPIGLAFGGGAIWVANSDDDTVTRVDPVARSAGAPIAVGNAPVAVAVAGDRVWVANQDAKTVSVLDAATGQPVGQPRKIDTRLRGLAAADSHVWAVGVEPGLLADLSG
jgi:YVTN family beta-propeller protein